MQRVRLLRSVMGIKFPKVCYLSSLYVLFKQVFDPTINEPFSILGRLVLMNNLTYMSNSSLHGDNPETFSGFRHVSKSPFARVGRDSMAFGLGKHACPGRWLASRNIKMAMSILIRKYEISTLDGKRPKYPIKRGFSAIGPLPLTFKKRK